MVILTTLVFTQQTQSTEVTTRSGGQTNTPIAISGDNIYVAWWTNKTANNNEEVMFRASTTGGQTLEIRST